jgi:LysM repeat protein
MSHKVLDYSYARFSPAQVHHLGAVAVGRYLTVVTGWRPGDDPSHVQPTIPHGKVWHKVKPGDTLSAIATAFDTTVEAIAALNPGLITDVNHIEIGWNSQVK